MKRNILYFIYFTGIFTANVVLAQEEVEDENLLESTSGI